MRLPTKEEIDAADSQMQADIGAELKFDAANPLKSVLGTINETLDPTFKPKEHMAMAEGFTRLVLDRPRLQAMLKLSQVIPVLRDPILGLIFQLGYTTGYNIGQSEALGIEALTGKKES